MQAAVVLGSFAFGIHLHRPLLVLDTSTGDEQNIESLVQAGCIVPLLDVLARSDDKKLQEASVRALKAIFQNASVPRDDVFRVSARSFSASYSYTPTHHLRSLSCIHIHSNASSPTYSLINTLIRPHPTSNQRYSPTPMHPISTRSSAPSSSTAIPPHSLLQYFLTHTGKVRKRSRAAFGQHKHSQRQLG